MSVRIKCNSVFPKGLNPLALTQNGAYKRSLYSTLSAGCLSPETRFSMAEEASSKKAVSSEAPPHEKPLLFAQSEGAPATITAKTIQSFIVCFIATLTFIFTVA